MDPPLEELARSQGGVLAWGPVDRNVGARALRAGELQHVRRGVVGLATVPAWRRELAAAVLVTAADVVVTHQSAAMMHGLPLWTPYAGAPVLSRVRPAGSPVPGRQRVSPLASAIDPVDRVVIEGLPVATVARTAVDLARVGPLAGSVMAVDAALRMGVSMADLDAVLERCRGWPGRRRAVVAVAFGDPRAESPLESLVRLRMHEGGLPAPELQVSVGDRYAPLARVDFLLEGRVVVEADGMLKYADPLALRQEKLREDRLRDLGFEVVRCTWAEVVGGPDLLVARVRRALARPDRRAS